MRQPSEEEIAALEAELEKLTVDDVLLQTVVTLLNLGARKAGLSEGATADLPQVKEAIDAARALLPILEPRHGEQLAPVRDALKILETEGIVTIHPRSGIQFVKPGLELTRSTYQFRGILDSFPAGVSGQLFALRLSQRISAPSTGSFSYSSSAASQ